MHELKVTIKNKRYPPPRPDIKWAWLRRILHLPAMEETKNVIKDFSLSVTEGKIVAIVGASAAGKTTVLRIIAGLETTYEGSVVFRGEAITKPDSRIYLMPQAHTLLPWLTVEGNLLFNSDDVQLTSSLLAMFKMSDKGRFYPRMLSGGERARVALMCAMCARPQVLLLDEPFRGLDQLTKEQCMADLSKWLNKTKHEEIVVFVSHDISDAIYFSDEVMVVGSNPLCVQDHLFCPSGRIRMSEDLIDSKTAR